MMEAIIIACDVSAVYLHGDAVVTALTLTCDDVRHLRTFAQLQTVEQQR